MAGRQFTRRLDGLDQIIYAEYINELQAALEQDDTRIDGKADTTHSHPTSDITGLDSFITLTNETLAGKSNVGHKHSASDISTGVIGPSFLPIGTTEGTVAAGNHNHDNVYQTITGVDDLLIPLNAHVTRTDNPHNVTKAQLGLSQVDNTSDLNKPISTATKTALDGKAPLVHEHHNMYYTETEMNTKLADKANSVHVHAIGDISGLQTALNSKSSTSHSHTVHGGALADDRAVSARLVSIADGAVDSDYINTDFWFAGNVGTDGYSAICVCSLEVNGASGTVGRFRMRLTVNGTHYYSQYFEADQGVDSTKTWTVTINGINPRNRPNFKIPVAFTTQCQSGVYQITGGSVAIMSAPRGTYTV